MGAGRKALSTLQQIPPYYIVRTAQYGQGPEGTRPGVHVKDVSRLEATTGSRLQWKGKKKKKRRAKVCACR